ncbi:G-protein coupled receptor moody [Folsomia candida]|uniref:G-protein coupled receptor moody n=1 Tax=Folsomia candida TaxID=158441 RepID=UPI000B904511|nr:G-protein coupled receptor moody [Folsomia candida]XP_021951464.1 G-protein coupled receptor moody [Folsomia candida]
MDEDTSIEAAEHHSCGNETVSEYSRFPTWALNFGAASIVIVIIVGILGNALTIIALSRCQRVRNVATAFIISLCVADFLFCLLVLPFSASNFIHRDWIHGSMLCTLFPLMRYGNLGVSLLSITMITINRYMMITSHKLYSRIYKPVGIGCMIAFCWVFSFLMQLPTLLGVWGKFGYDKRLKTCTIIEGDNKISSKTALFLTAFVIPCTIIVFCYARIFWTVHKSENRMRRHSARSDVRETRNRKNEWRITKMVLVIFISFVACYLPITIVKVADKCVNYPVTHVVGYVLVYMSACVNPIIYVFMNKQYRMAFQAVLCPSSLQSVTRVTFHSNKSKTGGFDGNSQTQVSRMSVTNANFVIRESEDRF